MVVDLILDNGQSVLKVKLDGNFERLDDVAAAAIAWVDVNCPGRSLIAYTINL